MRLILLMRLVGRYRAAAHELERSRQMQRWADDAFDRSEARLREADALAARLGLVPTV